MYGRLPLAQMQYAPDGFGFGKAAVCLHQQVSFEYNRVIYRALLARIPEEHVLSPSLLLAVLAAQQDTLQVFDLELGPARGRGNGRRWWVC